MDKIRDLELGEQVIGVAGILLFIDSFLNWFSRDFGGFGISATVTQNGWDNIFSLLAVLIGIAMVVVLVIQNFTGVGLPDRLGTLSWAQGYLIAGVVALALVVLQLIIGSDAGTFGVSANLNRTYGLWLGLIFSAGLAGGGFLMVQGAEEGEAPGGPAAPPPPPQS